MAGWGGYLGWRDRRCDRGHAHASPAVRRPTVGPTDACSRRVPPPDLGVARELCAGPPRRGREPRRGSSCGVDFKVDKGMQVTLHGWTLQPIEGARGLRRGHAGLSLGSQPYEALNAAAILPLTHSN